MAIRVEVQNLRVRSLDTDYQEISWEIAPFSSAQSDVYDYTFTVLRSGGPEGPFEAISPPLDDKYLFIDNAIKPGNIHRQYFYKILTTEKATEQTKETSAVQLQPEADLIALELRKHINLLMREFIGRRCWVFPVRTFGQRCECFNVTLHKKVRSGCRTCYDTGFIRGYFSPIESWISIDPNPKTLQQASIGETQEQVTTARLGYWPPLKPRDLIIEPENARWRVIQVNQTEHIRAATRQEIQIKRIHQSDIEYSIQFDTGEALRNMFLSPARNFTNPQSLENFEQEEIPKIFSLYPSSYPKIQT